MFTGIIESVATVRAVRRVPAGMRLDLDLGAVAEGLEVGASVAVNGACLTAARIDGSRATFDVVAETVGRTNLGDLKAGDGVNVERSLRVGASIDGHFVQGHVDGTGRISRIETGGGQWKLWCEPPAELMRYMVAKGSVAIDGISLTLVDVTDGEISVAVIPTTLKLTTLGRRRVGDRVNIESDLIARIVAKQLDAQLEAGRGGGKTSGGVTMAKLIEGGFV
ncbi:MAG: riboflavin synthase [Phycisphaerae bacterium]|nr:riboflavin synthase [Phycisphaerae bacterium]